MAAVEFVAEVVVGFVAEFVAGLFVGGSFVAA